MPAVDKAVQLVFDTNILVDALLARGHYYQYAVRLLEAVRSGEVEGWYVPHSVTTVYYLVERTLARETSSRKETVSIAQALVKKFMGILKPLPQVGDELLHLKGKPGDDLEDLLIVKLATGYLPNPLIVTRDKHFLHDRTCQAAHPKEIVESGLAPWLSDQKNPVQFIDLAAQQRLLRPKIQEGIPSVAYYTAPLHLQGAFAGLAHNPGDFPVAEQVAEQCLSLPMSAYLTQADQEKVVKAIGVRL